MKMLNIVSPVENLHSVLEDLVIDGSVHIQNYTKSNSSDTLTMYKVSEAMEDSIDIGSMQKLRFEKTDFKDLFEKLTFIADSIDMELRTDSDIDRDYDFEKITSRLNSMYGVIAPIKMKMENMKKSIQEKEYFLENISFLDSADIDISEIREMKHINYHIGTLTRENRIKLRDNYENISAIVLHIGSSEDGESYLIFSPAKYEEETAKILRSLNFKEIDIPDDINGNVSEVSKTVREQIQKLEKTHDEYGEVIKTINQSYKEEITRIYSEIQLEEKIEQMKENAAVTNNFFYFTGWVPEGSIQKIRDFLESKYKDIITVSENPEEIGSEVIPPTKLKNNWVISPFELLVNMYGVPNYNEDDPTLFLGVTYLILFGAMFGDVGQGLVLVLAGFLLRRKSKKGTDGRDYGEILFRIGMSSTFFGFMYGSIFGDEEVLPALIVRPLENINFVLYSAIAFGVILLLISFGISIYNLKREGDIKECLFGRNGLTGLIFYVSLLSFGLQMLLGAVLIPNAVLAVIMIASLAALLFKTPLYSIIFKEEAHYEEGKGTYYIEGGFDLIETILSLLSNSISFIRIGAFALNHVGLFLAFSTMAKIANSPFMGMAILVLGNIIIIGLEGLIVLIQGLRLEYYELFSKYFKGDGKSYIPVKFIEEAEEI